MKKLFFLLTFSIGLFLQTEVFGQKSAVVKTKYFNNLNTFDETEKYQWSVGNETIAAELEKSYNLYSLKKNFASQLIKFINNNADKCYWIATYLTDDYYTQINDKKLSFELFELGLTMLENADENEQIKYLYVIGKHYYFQGQKEKSLEYLKKGYLLADKYPGNVPTWNSLEESEEIYNFIKANL